MPQTGQLKEHLLPIVPESGKSKIKVPADSVLGESRTAEGHLQTVSHHGGEKGGGREREEEGKGEGDLCPVP